MIFSYIRRLGTFFGVQNFVFQFYLFFFFEGGGFRKINIFWGVKILWIFFGVITNWTIFRGHFYAFYGLFLRSRHRMGIFLGVSKTSNIFFRVLEIPDIFGGER